MDSGVEALQEQGTKNTRSIEDVVGSTQDIKSNVQALQRQNAEFNEAMEQAKLRMSRVSLHCLLPWDVDLDDFIKQKTIVRNI
jgi:hypothetical protein